LKIFTDHKLTLVAGFVLAALFLAIGLSDGNVPATTDLIG